MAVSLRSLAHRVPGVSRPPEPATVLIVLSQAPFDGDATWNALRLGATLIDQQARLRVFVMNDAIDLVRKEGLPAGTEFDLQAMLRALLARGARIKICTTCVNRCGIGHGEVMPEAIMATMGDLAAWVRECDRVLVF